MCNFPDLNCFLLKPDLSHKAGVEHVKAWLQYKAGTLMDNGKKVTDPDSSDVARDFYSTMWRDFLNDTGFELRPEPRDFSGVPEKYVQGDWMCSVATTFRKGLIRFVEKKELENLFPKGKKGIDVELKTYVPILLCDIACPYSKKQFQEFWDDPVLQNFIRSAYTFANLIIVPDGFNSRRNNPATNDYWDETLRLYFNEFDSECPLQYKKKENDEIIDYDCGTPFHKLVEKSRANGSDSLFLDEWLDKDKDDESIPLLDKELNTPNKPDDWRKLMEEMTRRIDNRRVQMQARINEPMN